jgi:diguanylate cyclase (GGDEF)-like protein
MASESESDWLYCIQCERAFRSTSKNSCQYESCEGDLGDIWEWEVIRVLNACYPRVPAKDTGYPLFGNGNHINFGKLGARLHQGPKATGLTGVSRGTEAVGLKSLVKRELTPMHIPQPKKTVTKILYIEDDNLTQGLVIQILQRRFPQVSIILAQNGRDGLDLFDKNRPEIVITDVRMPIVDGITMARRIKELDQGAQIIILSAADETNDILKAIDIGINHYVLKPIKVEKLIAAIEQCLSKIEISEELRHQEAYIRNMAYYDHLTGLPNRHLFSEFLRKALAHAQRHKRLLSLFFIDLDGFKKINDTLGHSVGDHLLQEVAQRLKLCCSRDQDTVARWGGDEFIILLPDLEGAQETVNMARKINQAFAHPLAVLGHELTVGISIGISLYPEDGLEEETLIKSADQAMYCAKSKGQNTFHQSARSE